MHVLSEEERQEKIRLGLVLWREHAEKYRTCVIKYRFLIREMQHDRLNVSSNARPKWVKESLINAYPNIPLFRFFIEDQVLEFLENADNKTLCATVNEVFDTVKLNHSYVTITNKVRDFEYVVNRELANRNYGKKTCIGSYDPSFRYISRSSHARNRPVLD